MSSSEDSKRLVRRWSTAKRMAVALTLSIGLCTSASYAVPETNDWVCDVSAGIAEWFDPTLAGRSWLQAQGVYESDTFYALRVLIIAGVSSSLSLAGFVVLTRIGRGTPDGHTRCGSCGYILKGLTEPRCSECGVAI